MKSLTAAGGNEVKKLVLHDALILPDSHHNLISLGILARDQHVGTWLAPGTGRSHLIFPDNVHARSAHKRGRARVARREYADGAAHH